MTRRTMLSDLEIDEVSTVDRPANQHGLITFSKRYGSIEKSTHTEEDLMSAGTAEIEVFDDEGTPVDPDSLEHGALVYDVDGNEYAYVEDEEDDDQVGKSLFSDPEGALNAARKVTRNGRAAAARGAANRKAAGAVDNAARRGRGAKDYMYSSGGTTRGADGVFTAGNRGLTRNGRVVLTTAGGAGAAGAAAGYETAKKSLGDHVLEELSKAVTEDDRADIIAKALDQVEIAKSEAAQVRKELDDERDLRLETEFISKADEYNLPVDPSEFGPVLKRLVERMDEDDLEILDQVFKSAGDLLYQEYGHVGGGSNSSIIDSVDALAGEMVTKAGGGFTTAEAQVALFEANPEAYDAYIQEGR